MVRRALEDVRLAVAVVTVVLRTERVADVGVERVGRVRRERVVGVRVDGVGGVGGRIERVVGGRSGARTGRVHGT